jgi:hypothetical protein
MMEVMLEIILLLENSFFFVSGFKFQVISGTGNVKIEIIIILTAKSAKIFFLRLRLQTQSSQSFVFFDFYKSCLKILAPFA